MAERPEGRGLGAGAPPELVSFDRRLLARLEEASRDEEAYFRARRARPEAGWIAEEHAALAEAAARGEAAPRPGAGTPEGATSAGRPGNVVLLRRAGAKAG